MPLTSQLGVELCIDLRNSWNGVSIRSTAPPSANLSISRRRHYKSVQGQDSHDTNSNMSRSHISTSPGRPTIYTLRSSTSKLALLTQTSSIACNFPHRLPHPQSSSSFTIKPQPSMSMILVQDQGSAGSRSLPRLPQGT